MKQADIQTPTTSYVVKYPEFVELTNTQIDKCFWTSTEIKVKKDIQDLRVNLPPTDQHGVLSVLALFVKYELFVGGEYWLTRVFQNFPIPEIQRMASCFGSIELNVHAPFYDQINQVMGLSSDEFYDAWRDDPVLVDRMDFIDNLVNCEDDALSVAGFTFIEGAVLYSSFAFLKHYQNNGKNFMMNVVRGVNQSAIDENLHAIGGALIFRKLIQQQERTPEEMANLEFQIRTLAKKVYEHEARVIERIFEKGPISGVTAHQLEEFGKSRVNICLENLGFEKMYKVTYNPIADWFYDALNNYQFNDFFTAPGREYVRHWGESAFGDYWTNKVWESKV